MKIQIPDLLVKLRGQLADENHGVSRGERFAYGLWAKMLKRPRLYRWATWLATRTAGRWYRQSPWLSRLPGKLHGWTKKRDFPAPAPQRFRDWWKEQSL